MITVHAVLAAMALLVGMAVPAFAQDVASAAGGQDRAASGEPVAHDHPAPGEPAEQVGSRGPDVQATVSNLTRVETWRFFEPPFAGVDPDYTFWSNRSDLEIRVRGRRVDLDGGFSYVRVEHLPVDAIGPGGLGTGAFYFAASGQAYSYQVFLSALTLSVHDERRRRTLAVGRMPYTSGAEGDESLDGDGRGALVGFADSRATGGGLAPDGRGAAPGSPMRGAARSDVRRLAIDGRLVGTFGWSMYQRRFDGARVDWRGDGRYAGGSAFMVSQGGYEESANLTIDRLQVGTAFAGQRHGVDAESQVFGVYYRDRRPVDIRPDNSLVPVEAADITIAAVGASHVAARGVGPGLVDYAAWGAWQGGDWYGQSHRAYGVAAQAGYRWPSAPWNPWVRGGASHASGDPNGRDDRHETFFPMLQETRSYAQSMVYAQANLRDLFAQVLAEPHARVRTRVDVHRLDLAEVGDRWYQGSGATARDGRFFGYSTRPSNGARGLGTVLEASADVRITRYWSMNGYAGRMWGGPVVRGSFAADRLFYWYVENVLRLDLRS